MSMTTRNFGNESLINVGRFGLFGDDLDKFNSLVMGIHWDEC